MLIGCADDNAAADDDGANPPPVAFGTPESALYDPDTDMFFVSNVAGESDAADGVGWIARLSADGEVLDPRWVEDLNAPKGMALVGASLYGSQSRRPKRIKEAVSEIKKVARQEPLLAAEDPRAGLPRDFR